MTGANWKSKAKTSLTLVAVIGILSSLLAGSSALAQGPEPTTLDPDDLRLGSSVGVASPAYEVATEWIAYFTQCPANNIACEAPQCGRFYSELVGAGWSGKFNYGNCNAWAKDFKKSPGWENSYIDSVDIALFCDHGSSGWDSFWGKTLSSLHFGCDGPDNDCNVTPGEAYMSYGDNDLEWLGFKACSVLGGGPAPYYNRGYWAATMDGLHQLLGFRNSSYCHSNFGKKWAQYMLGRKFLWWWLRPPYKVTQAWFEAVDDTQPGGVCARVLAEENYFYNDYVWGRGYVYPDYQDGDYSYWDHCSCTPAPLQVANVHEIETMPVYEVVDRQVDEGYVLEIASAFDMSGTIQTDGENFYMLDSTGVETYTLQVDLASGGYKYRNLGELWVSPIETPTLPLEGEALRLADEFFTGPGQALPAAAYRTGPTELMTEERVEVQQMAPELGILQEQELGRTPVLLSLSYGRVITPEVQVQTALGSWTQAQALSLVGPGARTKMYLGDMAETLGVQGGSRDIQTTGDQVTVMDAAKVWDMFVADPSIAVAPIPWVYDVVTKTAETLGYYEYPQSESQSELIPVWIFTADFYGGGELLEAGVLVYVPAAAEYMPPEVTIETPTAGAEFEPGEVITFSGSVEFGNPPYTYEWSSSHDGVLGAGATITASLTTEIREKKVVSHTISLQVTDSNAQQGAEATMVFVEGPIYLPIILKSW